MQRISAQPGEDLDDHVHTSLSSIWRYDMLGLLASKRTEGDTRLNQFLPGRYLVCFRSVYRDSIDAVRTNGSEQISQPHPFCKNEDLNISIKVNHRSVLIVFRSVPLHGPSTTCLWIGDFRLRFHCLSTGMITIIPRCAI